MPDYGHDIEFGYFLNLDAGDPDGVLETARLADRLGYDLLGVQDHPYQRAHLDSLALLGAAPLMNYQPPAQVVEAQALIDRAAREAGRDPSEIRRIYNIPGALAAAPPAPARDTDEAIVGPPTTGRRS